MNLTLCTAYVNALWSYSTNTVHIKGCNVIRALLNRCLFYIPLGWEAREERQLAQRPAVKEVSERNLTLHVMYVNMQYHTLHIAKLIKELEEAVIQMSNEVLFIRTTSSASFYRHNITWYICFPWSMQERVLQRPSHAHCGAAERGHRQQVARGQARHPQPAQPAKDHRTGQGLELWVMISHRVKYNYHVTVRFLCTVLVSCQSIRREVHRPSRHVLLIQRARSFDSFFPC